MSNFDTILPYILLHEGVNFNNPTGYANIPGDGGGETKWGISQRAWTRLLTKEPSYATFPTQVKDLTKDHAVAIYRTSYYLPYFDQLPVSTAMLLMDCEVNEGFATVVAQRAMGAKDDGVWGTESNQKLGLAKRDIPKFNFEILWQRLLHYAAIGRGNPSQAAFVSKFWIPRLNTCKREIRDL